MVPVSASLRAQGRTDTGPVRPVNEDRFVIDEALSLSVVADGMGGHNAGEVASRIAVEAILDVCRATAPLAWPFGFDPYFSEAGNLLRTALHTANARVFEAAGSSEQLTGMGTTVVAGIVREGRLSVAHVGDSRLYLYSGKRLRQVTRDDSWLASMLAENPEADPAMFQNHPMRNALTSVVGAERGTEVHLAEEPLEAGALLALTTDGVHGVLDARRLEELLAAGGSPAEIAGSLVEAALARGTRDNCTAVVAHYLAS